MGKGKARQTNERAVGNPCAGKGDNPCAPLSRYHAGDDVRIVEVDGDAALKRRLRHLGLRPGKSMHVQHKSPAGMVVRARGLKLALGRDAAAHILVEPEEKA